MSPHAQQRAASAAAHWASPQACRMEFRQATASFTSDWLEVRAP